MNQYEEISVAGEGAYGTVLKCKHKSSGSVVAIKRFKENDEEDEEAARVIQREIEILKQLKHEYIVSMRESFRDRGTIHIVFEYVDKSMLDIMDANPDGVDVDSTRRFTYQLTRAIEHCHRRRIIHRDIKPDNLLVGSVDNILRLCDFGSACVADGSAVLTDYAATRWYRAPELLVRFNDYGPGVDMWGLGCVMAELIGGQPLFTGKTDVDQLFIIINAIGPLTPEQTKRCFDLTGFVKFPAVGERQTIKKRLGQKGTEQQLHFLSRIFVVDATQRLTANTALSLPWLTDWSHSQDQRGVQIQPQVSAGDPDFGMQSKPRISKSLGVPGAVARERPAVGIVAGAQDVIRARCVAEAARSPLYGQEPEPESISSFQPGSAMQQGSHMLLNESHEELILEEISDGSIPEECGNSSQDASPMRPADAASRSAAAESGGYNASISATQPQESIAELVSGHQESMTALTESVSYSRHQDSMSIPKARPVAKPCGLSGRRETQEHSVHESMASIQESSASRIQDQNEESIMEELSGEQVTPEKIQQKPVTMPGAVPKRASPFAARVNRPSSERHRHIRPVSSGSARSSSMTPMA